MVIATSATRLQVPPLARELGVEHVLCTELEHEGGVLTGRLAGRAPWGDGKIAAVVTFAAEHGVDLAASHAYANGDEDVPLQTSVHPHPVNPSRGWPSRPTRAGRSWSSGRARFDPPPAVRTAAMYGSLLAASGGPGRGRADRRPATGRRPGHHVVRGPRRRRRRHPVRGHRTAARLVGPAGGVPHQPPEHADRPGDQPGPPLRLHRGGEGGGHADAGDRAAVLDGRRRLPGPGQPEKAIEALRPAVEKLRAGRRW